MTMTTVPMVTMSFKQHTYIVDLAAKRPNWVVQLTSPTRETVVDVLVNEQIRLDALNGVPNMVVSKAISIKDASAAISALLGIKPTSTVVTTAPTQPQTLKQVATKWSNDEAHTAPAPSTQQAPSAWQRLRQLLANLPDGAHIKFALTNDKGVVEFFSVDEIKKYGKVNGRMVRKLLGAPGDWHRAYLSVHQQLEIVRTLLTYGWEQAAKDYADKHGRCARCDAHLSDERSRAAKLGETCAGIWGWPW